MEKKARCAGVEFGEGAPWRRKPVGGGLGKLVMMWEVGVFLGVTGRTGECVAGGEEGVWETRAIQRKPTWKTWKVENVGLAKWALWFSHQSTKFMGCVFSRAQYCVRLRLEFRSQSLFTRIRKVPPRKIERVFVAWCVCVSTQPRAIKIC